ncbi:glyoxalase [Kouleothrix aurantiaca]|uniref:Glyoxalase n=1 Tax=Kouleothrix aurantiaca TaxID=186479 RepID=A0A0P9CWJ4_9CHLR|nr:glyoxalase [Kouleothrix aurantiaca]
MNQGIKVVVYPVADLAQAKETFKTFLGVEPYADSPYYVGFKVGDMDIGLDPNGHKAGMTAYYAVDNIRQNLQTLLDSGAELVQDIRDIGGGGLIASVRDAAGNIIGLRQFA